MELSNATGEYLRAFDLATRQDNPEYRQLDADLAETLVKLLAPIAPHWADELWQTVLGHPESSVHSQPWPAYDPEVAKADEVELAVQVNGKVKAKITVAADAPEEEVRAAGLTAVGRALEGPVSYTHLDVYKRQPGPRSPPAGPSAPPGAASAR